MQDNPAMSDPTSRPAAHPPLPSDFGRGEWGVRGDHEMPSGHEANGRPHSPLRAAAAPFDVCHAGLVLRAVCAVHAALAIATAFLASGAGSWLQLFAVGSVAALPATLLWLIAVCALKHTMALWSPAAQWIGVILLGALAGAAGWLQLWMSGLAFPIAGSAGPAWANEFAPYALAGGALAAALFSWLRARARAQAPADQAARLAELQTRIRPHFLFNTLNTAIALARVDPARTEHLLEDLAELFRGALSDERVAVPLADEVELAQRYLAIEQIRFGQRLRVSWELDPQASHARVPSLILQPLVENAVRHGVEPADAGGSIRVRTQARRGQAVIDIANTVPLEKAQPGHGMALDNVRERLRLMHDVSAQFHARQEGQVYRVRIVVPL